MNDQPNLAAQARATAIRAIVLAAGITWSGPDPDDDAIRKAIGVHHRNGEFARAEKLIELTKPGPLPVTDPDARHLADQQAALLEDIAAAFRSVSLPVPRHVPTRPELDVLFRRLRVHGHADRAERLVRASDALATALATHAAHTNGGPQ